MPEPDSFSENSSAPNILSVSCNASAGWWSAFANSARRAIVSAPSSSENDECTCKCTKSMLAMSERGRVIPCRIQSGGAVPCCPPRAIASEEAIPAFLAVIPASWPGDVGHTRLTGGTSFPQPSKTSQHLRPDGDHSDKQGQRGQSSSFLDHSFEHDFVSRNRERT